jgi:hypothetical protein
MNIIKYLLIFFVLFVFIASYEQNSKFIESKIYKGTLIEYNKCIENNKNQGLNESVLQELCLRKHQQDITGEIDLGVKVAYEYDFYAKKYAFSGYIENKSHDYVVTYAQLFVNHKENPGIEIIELEWLLIQPGGKEDFSLSELQYSPKTYAKDYKFSWSIAGVKGLKIILK